MTYVPPERDESEASDQTQPLGAPGGQAFPAVGNGVEGGSPAPFQPEPGTAVPFAADRGDAAPEPAPVTAGPGRSAGRDRIAFQLIWEAVLLVMAVAAVAGVYRERERLFGTAEVVTVLEPHLFTLIPVLMIVTAFGLSLRMGAVNLAIPAIPYTIASAPGLFVGDEPLLGLAWVAAAAAAVTAAYCLLNLVFRVPPWMAGLTLAFAAAGAARPLADLVGEDEFTGSPFTLDSLSVWSFAAVAVVSIAGGLLGLLPSVRDRFSEAKAAAAGTGPRHARPVAVLIAGTFASSLLAGLAGFVTVGVALPRQIEFGMLEMSRFGGQLEGTMLISPLVLIAVLLGGTALWGRRGGIAGSVLATVALWAAAVLWFGIAGPASDPEKYSRWTGLLAVGLLMFGLVVSHVLNRLGRPAEPTETESDDPPREPAPFAAAPTNLFEPDGEREQPAPPGGF